MKKSLKSYRFLLHCFACESLDIQGMARLLQRERERERESRTNIFQKVSGWFYRCSALLCVYIEPFSAQPITTKHHFYL